MKNLKELLERTSIKAITQRLAEEAASDPQAPSLDFVLPTMPMVEACRADDYDFFQPLIEAGRLTVGQMHHAAQRYHLGKTKSGKTIYWMIDETSDPQDARISNDTWLSTLLKAREPFIRYWCPTHCLFGLHLLAGSQSASNIAIVESEQSAVLLSEFFPESIWMAYATVAHLQVDFFSPLEGCHITFYPCTDPYMSNFLFFTDLAAAIRRKYPSIHITVDPILEDHATDQQKSRSIELLDFILES